VQPGFESLHLDALRLFDKGTTPVTNLQYLKSARAAGTFVTWNFLWQLPGEDWSWYASIAEWLPLVSHLQAPNTLCAVRFDRFSPYHQHPEAHGLRLRPTRGLEYIYPVDAATRADLAYYFTDFGRPVELALRRFNAGIVRFEAEMDRWMNLWDRVRRADADAAEVPKLEAREVRAGLEIVDTRPVAPEPVATLSGLDAEVLSICDGAPSRARLLRTVRDRPERQRLAESTVNDSIERLKRRLLILELDGRLLALPTAVQKRPFIPVQEYPGGHLRGEHEPRHLLELTPAPKVVTPGGEDPVRVETRGKAPE
jgi:magnesium-protoporphyrin IX monomethyl ester (oxidative) cyclase